MSTIENGVSNPTPVLDLSSITKGTVIKTYNKSIKKDFDMLVLGDTGMYICVKLTDNDIFSEVPNIRIDVSNMDIDYKEKPYLIANVFSGTNAIKYEYVTKVCGKVKPQEYFSVLSTMMSFFLGFCHRDKDGKYIIDTPYVKDPIFTMMFGMCNLADIFSMEARSKERLEAKKVKEKQEEIKSIDTVKANTPIVDLSGFYADIDKYSDDTNLRVDAIFRVFERMLINGKLPVVIIAKAIINGTPIGKIRKNASTIDKDQMMFIVNHTSAEVSKAFGISPSVACNIRRYTKIVYYGSANFKSTATDTSIEEFILGVKQSDSNIKRADIINLVVEKFGCSKSEATRNYYNIIKRNTKKESKSRVLTDSEIRVLRLLDLDWIKAFDRYKDVENIILDEYPNRTEYFNGKVFDSGDIVMDAICIYIIAKSVNRVWWINVLELDSYAKFRNKFVKLSYDDIIKRFKFSNSSQKTNFSVSAIIIISIMCQITTMPDRLTFIYSNAAKSNVNMEECGKYMTPLIPIFFRGTSYNRPLMKKICKKFEINDIQFDCLLSKMRAYFGL